MDIIIIRKKYFFLCSFTSPPLPHTGINQTSAKTFWRLLKMKKQKTFYSCPHKAEENTGGDKTGFLGCWWCQPLFRITEKVRQLWRLISINLMVATRNCSPYAMPCMRLNSLQPLLYCPFVSSVQHKYLIIYGIERYMAKEQLNYS